jgi:hypothetical protein
MNKSMNKKPLAKFLSPIKGFAIVEALVAAGIIGMSMIGMGVGLRKVAETRSLVKEVSSALAIESSLQAAIQDPSQYSAISETLRHGVTNVPTFQFQLHLTDLEGVEKTISLTANSDIKFKADGSVSPGEAADWAFQVRVQGVRKGMTLVPIYALAYQVKFNPQTVRLANLGATTDNFQDNDYKWMIPLEGYQDMSVQTCNLSDRDVIVTGINKETHQVSCLKVGDSSKCAADEIATGWVYETATSGGSPIRQLKMGCRKLSALPACPSLGAGGYEYVINSIDPRSTTSTPHGQCVFIAQGSANVTMNLSGVASTRSSTFNVCPPHYEFKPAASTSNGCVANVQQSFNGWTEVGCPAGEVGVNWVQNFTPAPLNISGAILNGGTQVSCSLSNDQQMLPGADNWAGFEAKISVNGSCVLSSSEMKTFN